jgi:hypothetical protein
MSKQIAANCAIQQDKNETKQTTKRLKRKQIKAILSKGKDKELKSEV